MKYHKHHINAVIAVIIPLLVFSASLLSFFTVFENRIFDIFMRLKPVSDNSRNILFLEQDDAAISEIGRTPWPREKFARMLSILSEFSPKAVIFDIEFIDRQEPVPENKSGQWIIKDQDAVLAEAIRRSGNVFLTFQGKKPPLAFNDISSAFDKISVREPAYWKDMIRQYRMLAESLSLISIREIESGYISETADKFGFSGRDRFSLAMRRSLGMLLITVQEENLQKKADAVNEILVRFMGYAIKRSYPGAGQKAVNEITAGILNGEGYSSIAAKYPALRGKFSAADYEKIAALFDHLYRTGGIWGSGSTGNTFISEVNRAREKSLSKWGFHAMAELDRIIDAIDSAVSSGEKDKAKILTMWTKAESLLDRKKAAEMIEAAKTRMDDINRINMRQVFFSKIRGLDRVIETSSVIPAGGSIKSDEIENIFFIDTVTEPVCDYAKGFGFTNILYDIDGSVRSVRLLYRYDAMDGRSVILPSLAFRPFIDFCGFGTGDILVKRDYIEVNNRRYRENGLPENIKIPLNDDGYMKVNWVNRDWPGLFSHLSIAELFRYDSLKGIDVLRRDRDNIRSFLKNRIAGKTIFVGLTAASSADIGIIPVSSHSPMVAVHANVFNNLQTGNFLIPAGNVLNFLIAVLLCFPAVLLIRKLKPLVLFSAGTGITILCFACSFILMLAAGIILKPLFIGTSVFTCYSAFTLMRYREIDSERRFIQGAFGQYLSPEVIRQIIDNPEKLLLGGEKRLMTAMFTDLQGFSSISEKLSPESLVSLLNEYLTEMCDIIAAHNGVVDKFEGDAIIAFWGAPVDDPDHARNACLCAIEMQKRLRDLRAKWKEEGRKEFIYELKMRIGINTGEIVVGNMGSSQRMDYTIMGDSVNLAARLEGVNKFYGTYTLISEFTASYAGDAFKLRPLDRIRVVGKSEPVEVSELLDETSAGINPAGLEAFRTGLELYRKKSFTKAKVSFKKALELMPGDGPSAVYIERCTDYLKNPPQVKWDGVYNLTAKG
jgi:class 3 adenylate cyclase/CHASE2 domain-containing sensor protein